MLSVKKFAKIEHYWLTDFHFRKMIQNWGTMSDNLELYSDLPCLAAEFFEFQYSLTRINYNPPTTANSCFEFRKAMYEFGRSLGLQGEIAKLRADRNWSKILQEEPQKITKYVEDIQSKFTIDLSFFAHGLIGFLVDEQIFSIDSVLTNRAGYDYFYELYEKKK